MGYSSKFVKISRIFLLLSLVSTIFCAEKDNGYNKDSSIDLHENRDRESKNDLELKEDANIEIGLESCTIDENNICWNCQNCPKDYLNYVGCKSKGECELFCTSCMPDDYKECRYATPESAAEECLGWIAPKGTIEDCTPNGQTNGLDTYCCSFCTAVLHAATAARSEDGTCIMFCDSCIASGYKTDVTCWPQ